jgi:hypothetical protein
MQHIKPSAMLAAMADTQWIGLIGALGGVVVSGVVGLTTATLTHRWQRAGSREDRSHQARETIAALRREAYARYLTTMEAAASFILTRPPQPDTPLADRLRSIREEDPKIFDDMDAAETNAQLLAGDRVLAALEVFDADWWQAASHCLEADDALRVGLESPFPSPKTLVAAMRDEQTELLKAQE